MSSFGKKFLSAFLEVTDDKETKEVIKADEGATSYTHVNSHHTNGGGKFIEYFNKLFDDAKHSGPGYYEFSRMTEAMQGISDEKSRYCAAFAGLQVQGVDKQYLLSSVQEYLQLLEADATAFRNTVDATLQEKVVNKKQAIEEAKNEMQTLSKQIVNLQQKIVALTNDIAENEAKIESNSDGYSTAFENFKSKLLKDIERINQHIL